MTSRTWIALASLLVSTFVFGGAWLWWTNARFDSRRPADPNRLPPADGICRDDADCPVGRYCTRVLESFDCIPDACATDHDCRSGEVCRTVHNVMGRKGPRQCVLSGTRAEGERCRDMPQSRSEACRPELQCNFVYCGRPCRMAEPGTCPEGFVCHEGFDGPSCTPSCKERGCASGQTCMRFGEAGSPGERWECAVLTGVNCSEQACPTGQTCAGGYFPNEGRAAMKCMPRCGPEESCPRGSVCVDDACLKRCRATEDDCEPGTACTSVNLDKFIYACEPSPVMESGKSGP